MNVITNTLKENLMLSCYLQTQTVYEIKTEDVYEDFYKDKICLILVIIHKIQSFITLSIKKLLVK